MSNEIFARVCLDGHIINTASEDDLIWEEVKDASLNDFNESVPINFKESVGIRGDNYCQDCGESTTDTCPNCQTHFIRLNSEFNNPLQLPDYCRFCGESFPWVSTIDEKKARDDLFLEIDQTEVNGRFYLSLVQEINNCYQIKANEATKILYRKLLENLMIDILRGHYGPENIDLYYDTEHGKFHSFSGLLSNFKASEDDLRTYSSTINQELYRAIQQFKYHGDASAHTIEPDISDQDLESINNKALKIARILFEIRDKVHQSGGS